MISPRVPKPTVTFIDDYCELYEFLFPEVRSFEAFKYLHLGMICDIKRKTYLETRGVAISGFVKDIVAGAVAEMIAEER